LAKPYEAKYYENSGHVLIRRNNDYNADAIKRSVAFFHEHLGR
jgi:dipeptidyl aminopeptidase/acylaminoacyl peptidase